MPEKKPQSKATDKTPNKSVVAQVAERIKNCDNVLVALSKNPGVDELSAAIGLTFILDKLGKHATAIFSGAVPNAIEFLEPEKTFETNTNSLQDFIIALDKEKADHLRYKIDGDFVKVFITPYRTTLSEDDLEFSHGDYNVDLIIALNVDAEADLDNALSEYGRIKHDASSIKISAATPGKFGDLEWGDPSASSVSEMIANLADILDDGSGEPLLDKTIATALLAGIVSATNRFSNERTTPDTMSLASALMKDGADQQLISSSIPVDILTSNTADVNEAVAELEETESAEEAASEVEEPAPKPVDPTQLTIEREEKNDSSENSGQIIPSVPVKSAEEELSAKKPDNVPDLPQPEPAPIEPADETPIAPAEAPEIETTAVPAPAEAAPVDLPTPELEPLAEPLVAPKAEPTPVTEPVPEQVPAMPLEPQIIPSPKEQISEPLANSDSAAVSTDKKLVPPSEEGMPDRSNVDYASAMERELEAANIPTPTTAPEEYPVNDLPTIEAPVASDIEASVVPNADASIPPENAVPVVPQAVSNIVTPEAAATPPVADFQPQPDTNPAQPPVAPMGVDPSVAEYVTPPLPMPSDGAILPPPPLPFDMGEEPAPQSVLDQPAAPVTEAQPQSVLEQPAPQSVLDQPAAPVAEAQPQPDMNPAQPQVPTAQEFAQNIQNEVQAAAEGAPIEPIMPAVLQEEELATPAPNLGANPVMQDQVYNDPSAFRIPGM